MKFMADTSSGYKLLIKLEGYTNNGERK